jgi:hypothetical protein
MVWRLSRPLARGASVSWVEVHLVAIESSPVTVGQDREPTRAARASCSCACAGSYRVEPRLGGCRRRCAGAVREPPIRCAISARTATVMARVSRDGELGAACPDRTVLRRGRAQRGSLLAVHQEPGNAMRRHLPAGPRRTYRGGAGGDHTSPRRPHHCSGPESGPLGTVPSRKCRSGPPSSRS